MKKRVMITAAFILAALFVTFAAIEIYAVKTGSGVGDIQLLAWNR